MAKPGRPKKPSTLEKERVILLLSNPPAHVRRLTDDQIEKLRASSALVENDRKTLLKRFKFYGRAIPEALIYQLDSIEHEIYNIDQVAKIKKIFNDLTQSINRRRVQGTKTTSENALIRAKAVWSKNEVLVERIAKKTMTINSASIRILENWEDLGDGKQKPSQRTLANWFNKISR